MPGSWPMSTVERVENVAEQARKRAAELAVQDMSGLETTDDVHVRDLLPQYDIDAGDDNGWDGDTPQWFQGALGEGENYTYQVNSDERADNRVVIIYGLMSDNDGDYYTDQVEVRAGKNGQLGVRDIIDTQGIFTDPEGFILFNEGMTFRHNESAQVLQHVGDIGDATDVDENIIFKGVVAEPKGDTITPRSDTRQ